MTIVIISGISILAWSVLIPSVAQCRQGLFKVRVSQHDAFPMTSANNNWRIDQSATGVHYYDFFRRYDYAESSYWRDNKALKSPKEQKKSSRLQSVLLSSQLTLETARICWGFFCFHYSYYSGSYNAIWDAVAMFLSVSG